MYCKCHQNIRFVVDHIQILLISYKIKSQQYTLSIIGKCFQYATAVVLNHDETQKVYKQYQKLSLL